MYTGHTYSFSKYFVGTWPLFEECKPDNARLQFVIIFLDLYSHNECCTGTNEARSKLINVQSDLDKEPDK